MDIDASFEKLHRLAALDRQQLIQEFGAANVVWLEEFAQQALPDFQMEPCMTAEAFADNVHQLRNNEREWARYLGDTLIKADECFSAGNVKAGIAIIERFIASCPWTNFVEIAQDHQASYGQ